MGRKYEEGVGKVVTATSHCRGHVIFYDKEKGKWLYKEGRTPVNAVCWPCIRCGRLPTPEGYDACLGHIEGAVSACCGHGVEKGYVIYKSGKEVKL